MQLSSTHDLGSKGRIPFADPPDSPEETLAASRKLQGGSTLVEVVIAIAVLTTVTLSSLLVLMPIVHQTRLNREVDTATASVRRVLERIQSAPFTEITSLYPDGTTLPVGDLENGTITVNYPARRRIRSRPRHHHLAELDHRQLRQDLHHRENRVAQDRPLHRAR